MNVGCAVERIEDAPVDNRLLAAAQRIEDALRRDTSEDGTVGANDALRCGNAARANAV